MSTHQPDESMGDTLGNTLEQEQRTVYTIGHSTHSIEEFLGLLRAHGIATLLDIRSFPGSRHCPQFGSAPLEAALEEAGIGYGWAPGLGGRRYLPKNIADHDPRIQGWRVSGFRAFAHYALEDPDGAFSRGLLRLEDDAQEYRLAYMCSEHTHLKCHRRIVSDYLMARGWRVLHIESNGKLLEHTLTPGAVMTVMANGAWIEYPSPAVLAKSR